MEKFVIIILNRRIYSQDYPEAWNNGVVLGRKKVKATYFSSKHKTHDAK